jgi:hypothetical protein
LLEFETEHDFDRGVFELGMLAQRKATFSPTVIEPNNAPPETTCNLLCNSSFGIGNRSNILAFNPDSPSSALFGGIHQRPKGALSGAEPPKLPSLAAPHIKVMPWRTPDSP